MSEEIMAMSDEDLRGLVAEATGELVRRLFQARETIQAANHEHDLELDEP